jgi:MFS family permease
MTDAEGMVPARTIAGIALASALVPLNSTMIVVALPEIARDFDITKAHASVLITVYLAAMLLGQPLAGRLADVIGARRLALLAVTGFGLFSGIAMSARSFPMLVGIRALQAAFAAALSPSVQAMLRQLVSVQQRGKAFGLQGSIIGVGAGLGPVIGGLVTAGFGWHAIFGVNIPVVIVILLVLRRTPRPRPSRRDAVVVGHSTTRLINGRFAAAFGTQAISTFTQYALLLAVPTVLDSRGWSAAAVGVGVSCLTVGIVVMGPLGGRLGDVHGRQRPVLVGLAAALAAVLASAVVGDHVASMMLLATVLIFGLGLGLATPSVMTAGIEAAPEGRIGAAAGLSSASRYVGSITAAVVLAGVVDDDGSGLSVLLGVCCVALALSLVCACGLPGRRPSAATRPSPLS